MSGSLAVLVEPSGGAACDVLRQCESRGMTPAFVFLALLLKQPLVFGLIVELPDAGRAGHDV